MGPGHSTFPAVREAFPPLVYAQPVASPLVSGHVAKKGRQLAACVQTTDRRQTGFAHHHLLIPAGVKVSVPVSPRPELASLGFLENGAGPGSLKHLDDVTNTVRKDVSAAECADGGRGRVRSRSLGAAAGPRTAWAAWAGAGLRALPPPPRGPGGRPRSGRRGRGVLAAPRCPQPRVEQLAEAPQPTPPPACHGAARRGVTPPRPPNKMRELNCKALMDNFLRAPAPSKAPSFLPS